MTFFTNGGVQFPLTAATSNSALRDADPALYFALDYVATVLESHIGARLRAQATLANLSFRSAVAMRLSAEPSPFLMATQFKFPLLAVYRKSEIYADGTVRWPHDVSEWEYVYSLGPLTPPQLDQMYPLLRAAAVTIARCLRNSYDTSWRDGASIYDVAGIRDISVKAARYGGLEAAQEIPEYYRAVVGTIEVAEAEEADVRDYDLYDGADSSFDHQSSDETVVADLVETSSKQAPTVASVSPSSGSAAGGTTITITGTGFRVGTPAAITVGTAECTNVVILSSTQVRGVTSAHGAYDSFAADVVVTVDDGEATLTGGYTYTTP